MRQVRQVVAASRRRKSTGREVRQCQPLPEASIAAGFEGRATRPLWAIQISYFAPSAIGMNTPPP